MKHTWSLLCLCAAVVLFASIEAEASSSALLEAPVVDLSTISGKSLTTSKVGVVANFSCVPDIMVSRKFGTEIKGDDVYSDTVLASQRVTQKTKGNPVNSYIQIGYDCGPGLVNSTASNTLILSGTKGNKSFRTKYFNQFTGENITGQMVTGNLLVFVNKVSIDVFKQKVKPGKRIQDKKRKRRYVIQAAENMNRTDVDVASIVVNKLKS